jgi:ribonuclease HII
MDMILFENIAKEGGYHVIAGIDEAGRGPLAGPVVAASCLFDDNIIIDGVNDSKKLAPKKRRYLYEQIIQKASYGVGIIDRDVIDSINIYQATIQAMRQAVDNMPVNPDYLLVDGLALFYPGVESEKIIKGDSKSISIAAASIIAKETRDDIMRKYHERWPEYGFEQHKGYGTKQHIAAIEKYGPCPIHRRSFEPIKSLMEELLV